MGPKHSLCEICKIILCCVMLDFKKIKNCKVFAVLAFSHRLTNVRFVGYYWKCF